jgi:osmotically-inducible protein OsmY
MHKPNQWLEADVRDSLDWDPQLDDSRIVVGADDGRVTLSGSVPTYFEVALATDDTGAVGGVTAIENQLLVGLVGDAITDAELAAASADALDNDRFVPKGAVTADVLEGFVTLTGQVRHHFQRMAAEHAVGRVDGVLGIDDNVTLTGDPIPSDVADRIQKALRRDAVVDDALIEVTNSGHTIYLDGKTSSIAARSEAEMTAWQAPGVTEVVDRLEIAP